MPEWIFFSNVGVLHSDSVYRPSSYFPALACLISPKITLFWFPLPWVINIYPYSQANHWSALWTHLYRLQSTRIITASPGFFFPFLINLNGLRHWSLANFNCCSLINWDVQRHRKCVWRNLSKPTQRKKAIDNGVGDSVIAVQCLKDLCLQSTPYLPSFLELSACQAAEIGNETRLK